MTIPRQQLQEGFDAVLKQPEKYHAAFNYGGPRGFDNLIASLLQLLYSTPSTELITPKREIIVGPNGATGLLESIAHVVAPGIVIASDPMYCIYCNLLERLGFTVVDVPEDYVRTAH